MGTYEGFLRAPWCALWGPHGLSSTTANSQTQWLLTSSSAPCTYSTQCSTSYRHSTATLSQHQLFVLYPVYTIQPVVNSVWQPAVSCKQTSNRLSNGFDNCVERTATVHSHCTFNRLSNRVVQPAVYTIQSFVKPVVKWVWQPVECLYTRYNRLSNWFDNRLYHVNGVLECRDVMSSVGRQERHLVCKHLLQLLPRVIFWPKPE